MKLSRFARAARAASLGGIAGIVLILTGCDRPCDQLADRLCQRAGADDAACAKWQDRVSRVSTKTCEVGLRALDRDRLR
jgi:hypothetical protein